MTASVIAIASLAPVRDYFQWIQLRTSFLTQLQLTVSNSVSLISAGCLWERGPQIPVIVETLSVSDGSLRRAVCSHIESEPSLYIFYDLLDSGCHGGGFGH